MGAGVEHAVGECLASGTQSTEGNLDYVLLPRNGRICSPGPSVSKTKTPNRLLRVRKPVHSPHQQGRPLGLGVGVGQWEHSGTTQSSFNISVVIFYVSKLRPREEVTASTSQVRPVTWPRGSVSCVMQVLLCARTHSGACSEGGRVSTCLSLPSYLPTERWHRGRVLQQ